MKNILNTISCLALLSTSIINAQWESMDKIKGNGKIITENRTTTSYDEIKISGFFDVELIAGTEGQIVINGEENLLAYIKVEVENNALKVYTDKNKYLSCSKGKSIQISIPFDVISQLSLSGSGDIKTKSAIKADKFTAKLSGSGDLELDIIATDFEMNLSGSGDIDLNGSAENFISKTSGSGDVDAAGLKCKNVDVAISGSGNYKVFCTGLLKARISGSGDIIYKGNPINTDTKVSGSGDIVKE